MLDIDFEDKIKNTLDQLEINVQRLNYAFSRLEKIFPLDNNIISEIEPEYISFMDQYIFRFAKTQDLMGGKLFPMILQAIGEETDKLAFLDILNRLEKLNIIADKSDWLELRKLRNEVSHEYPIIDEQAVSSLNNLFNAKQKLEDFFYSCKNYLDKRMLS